MTEDDTFRILKRRPWNDVHDLYCDFLDGNNDLGVEEFERKVEEYGWTWKEFNRVYAANVGR